MNVVHPLTGAEAAIISAGIAGLFNVLPWLFKWSARRRMDKQRLTLKSVREDADRLDNSYKRLESENARLWNRVNSLETAITIERGLVEDERADHDKTKRRCTRMERALRMAGIEIPEEDE